MDAALLAAAPGRRVTVLPYALRPGRDRDQAGTAAARWFQELGCEDVRVAVDETDDKAFAEADVLVLPGGSPARLLAALRPHAGTLRAAVDGGAALLGAGAGAMVLCRWTVLPEGRPTVEPALGLVDVDLVLPHYGGSDAWLRWARADLPAGSVALGLPERSGVIVDGGHRRSAGVGVFSELPIS
jgi:peptidase E